MYILRKLFWGMLASGAFMFFTGFSNVPQKFLSTFKAYEELKKSTAKKGDKSRVPASTDSILSTTGAAIETPKVKYEEKVEVVDDKKYVLISGKYYEYREDHIYMVNGVRTYFVDNKKIVTEDSEDSGHSAGTEGVALANYESKKAELNKDDQDGVLPTAEEALKKLKALQGMNQARDQYLEQIRTDGK